MSVAWPWPGRSCRHAANCWRQNSRANTEARSVAVGSTLRSFYCDAFAAINPSAGRPPRLTTSRRCFGTITNVLLPYEKVPGVSAFKICLPWFAAHLSPQNKYQLAETLSAVPLSMEEESIRLGLNPTVWKAKAEIADSLGWTPLGSLHLYECLVSLSMSLIYTDYNKRTFPLLHFRHTRATRILLEHCREWNLWTIIRIIPA